MASNQITSTTQTHYIRPSHGLRAIDLRELWSYRDLFFLLVWRDIKVRYAQSVLGFAWAIVQPVAFMVVFTVVFGNLVKMSSDGAPYAIFSYTALVPWTFFSTSLSTSTGSLAQNFDMLTKIYFPRLIMPLSAVAGKLVDFVIALTLVVGLLVWFKIIPTMGVAAIPLFVLIMVMTAAGLGMWLSALAVQYRDIQYGMNFITQLLMYTAPVVYPASVIPEQFRLLYAVNPMVGVIEGFRSALIGTNPMPWDLLLVGSISALVIVVSGLFYFRKMERIFADVA